MKDTVTSDEITACACRSSLVNLISARLQRHRQALHVYSKCFQHTVGTSRH